MGNYVKHKCIACGKLFDTRDELMEHDKDCEGIKELQAKLDREIPVENGENILKEIFKPDNEKTRDLESGKIRLTNWHLWVLRVMEQKLKKEGALKSGVNFIKRRLILHGLGKITSDNKEKVRTAYEDYEKWLQKYDRRKNQRAKKAKIIGDVDGRDKVNLYMKESEFSRVRDLAQIFDLTNDSIERIAFGYSIIDLKEYIDNEVVEEAQKDIVEFKEHLKGTMEENIADVYNRKESLHSKKG